MSARKTALDALIACRKQAAWSNGVLKDYIARDRLDRRDAALATRLCYGVLQHRGMLDFFLQQLLTGKVKDLQRQVKFELIPSQRIGGKVVERACNYIADLV